MAAENPLLERLDPIARYWLQHYGAHGLRVATLVPTNVVEGVELQSPRWNCCVLWEPPSTLHVVRVEKRCIERQTRGGVLPTTLFGLMKALRLCAQSSPLERVQFEVPLHQVQNFTQLPPQRFAERLGKLGVEVGVDAEGVSCWIWRPNAQRHDKESTRANRDSLNGLETPSGA